MLSSNNTETSAIGLGTFKVPIRYCDFMDISKANIIWDSNI